MIARVTGFLVALLAAGTLIWLVTDRSGSRRESAKGDAKVQPAPADVLKTHADEAPTRSSHEIEMKLDQQKAVGLVTAKVASGTAFDVLSAPGQVAPNESQYAFITPRAAGVVRTVNARIGQHVHAGDLLATIDSPVVGEARLELYTKLQMMEVAKAQAEWEEMVYRNTNELIDHLRMGDSPEQIQRRFLDRAVGENRERLMTAYAQYRLAAATIDRNRELNAQKLITSKQFQEVTAGYEVAQATYQSLMDQMGYEGKLANTRARQAKHQAESAVRTAQERLRIFGVKPDGTEPEVEGGKVIGVKSDGTLPVPKGADESPDEKPEAILPHTNHQSVTAVQPVGVHSESIASARENPVSTYSIWAPFDGTILDREMIVPGVAVDTTHRIFTMANLDSVWVEASVPEGDFNMLSRSGKGGKVRFKSPAYRDLVFEGEVIYSGDLVDEKSRTVKLLAKANNPDRLLKPGMFVEVEVLSPRAEAAVQVPASALLADEGHSFVYVRMGPDRFARREVDAELPRGGMITIRQGLQAGDEIVVEGEYKLRAMAVQVANAGR